MKKYCQHFVLITGFFLININSLFSQQEHFVHNKNSLVFSAIKGQESKPDTLFLSIPGQTITRIDIEGSNKDSFKILSSSASSSKSSDETLIICVFRPATNFTGIAKAKVTIKGSRGKTLAQAEVRGLSTKGLEGENEAPLSAVVSALGNSVDVGWKTLANNLRPELQGEELPPSLFKKAGIGSVEIIPVARYSPDFPLSFGFYIPGTSGPIQHQVGVLASAGKFPEHQTLFPGLKLGGLSFDPGASPFGFYAISPTHTAYSEDIWNILFHPGYASHATRIYPWKDESGKLMDNAYLVCYEEAANGDYNDYVFLVKNITPVHLKESFTPLFNGKDFGGWYKWLQSKGKNNDPDKVFTVENEIIHDLGKELGYIMTEKSYKNYHFILQFKWGEKKWAPRDTSKRDSGICYNISESENDKIWPKSLECQVQEGDVGDFWLLDYSTIQVDGKQNPPLQHSRMTKKKDAEKSNSEWNTVEIINYNGKCAHVVNGEVVNYGENSSLISGKILLQSEYAEIFYKNIMLREL